MVWFLFYLFFFCLSAYIGYHKGSLIAGLLLGYVLGPIGALLMLLSKDRRHKVCPHCHASIHIKSYFCPSCKEMVRVHSLEGEANESKS